MCNKTINQLVYGIIILNVGSILLIQIIIVVFEQSTN